MIKHLKVRYITDLDDFNFEEWQDDEYLTFDINDKGNKIATLLRDQAKSKGRAISVTIDGNVLWAKKITSA